MEYKFSVKCVVCNLESILALGDMCSSACAVWLLEAVGVKSVVCHLTSTMDG